MAKQKETKTKPIIIESEKHGYTPHKPKTTVKIPSNDSTTTNKKK